MSGIRSSCKTGESNQTESLDEFEHGLSAPPGRATTQTNGAQGFSDADCCQAVGSSPKSRTTTSSSVLSLVNAERGSE
jgi:hypothetical protein